MRGGLWVSWGLSLVQECVEGGDCGEGWWGVGPVPWPLWESWTRAEKGGCLHSTVSSRPTGKSTLSPGKPLWGLHSPPPPCAVADPIASQQCREELSLVSVAFPTSALLGPLLGIGPPWGPVPWGPVWTHGCGPEFQDSRAFEEVVCFLLKPPVCCSSTPCRACAQLRVPPSKLWRSIQSCWALLGDGRGCSGVMQRDTVVRGGLLVFFLVM